uniref:Uncharacterized protein n=1 Tax=Pithovirus LCPAC102 TaxID=2506587 RepID=A0A4D5XFG8_9VIRU|nr:MAG: hypothetical protein LCPAC102_01710 [Pithovirus LCPAC102]
MLPQIAKEIEMDSEIPDTCSIDNTNCYKFFPWMEDKITSRSSPFWLMCHTFIALLHIGITVSHFFVRKYNINEHGIYTYTIDKQMKLFTFEDPKPFIISHFMFVFLIVINITNFGDTTILTSILINGIPLSIIHYLFNPSVSTKLKDFLYITVMVSPVFLEVGLFIKSIL